jgi:hypothetical protein
LAGVSWATYTYDTDKSEWRALDLAEALVALAQRYGRPATGENPDVVAGNLLKMQDVIDADKILEIVGKVSTGAANAPELEHAKTALEDAATIGRRIERGVATVALWTGIGLAIAAGVLQIVAHFAAPDVAQDLVLAANVLSTVSGAIGLAMQIYTVVRTTISVASTAGVSIGTALSSTLTAVTKIGSATGIAAIIGAVISVVMTWGSFIYSVCSGGVATGSVAFNSGLAAAIAATILAIVLFAISLTVIGSVISALASLIDLILGFFGITGSSAWVTKKLAETFYQAEVLIDLRRDDLLSIEDLGMSLRNPEDGIKEGNQVQFEATILNTVRHRDFRESYDGYYLMPDRMAATYLWTPDTLKATRLYYLLAANAVMTQLDFAKTIAQWIGSGNTDRLAGAGGPMDWFNQTTFVDYYPPVCTDFGNGPVCRSGTQAVRKYQAQSRRGPITSFYGYVFSDDEDEKTVLPGGVLAAGVNAMQPLFLYMAYEVPTSSCWLLSSCETKPVTGTARINLGGDIHLDVMPATLDGFYQLNWAYNWLASALPAWLLEAAPLGPTFPPHKDYDGDGLLASDSTVGGNDPDDHRWDTDGDGLSDYFELNWRGTGGAGLTAAADGGLNPTAVDTDGDGLSDWEEVTGWAFAYAEGKTTWVTSSPVLADTDGDGLTDAMEKSLNARDPTLRLNPRAWNQYPVTIITEVSDDDGYVTPGANLTYTVTLRNDLLTDMYVQGALTTTLPAALGGRTITRAFDLGRDGVVTQSVPFTVQADLGSQKATIRTEASARLVSYEGQSAPPQGIAWVMREDVLAIDNDLPTATLASLPFVTPGGTRVIWGTASDPSSPVARVDVRLDGGAWQAAEGTTHWTYAVDLPGEEGAHTLAVRTTDAVGTRSSPRRRPRCTSRAYRPMCASTWRGIPSFVRCMTRAAGAGASPSRERWSIPPRRCRRAASAASPCASIPTTTAGRRPPSTRASPRTSGPSTISWGRSARMSTRRGNTPSRCARLTTP